MEVEKLKLARSCAVSLSNDPTYVLQFANQKSHTANESTMFAVAVSENHEIKLYDQETFCTKGRLIGHECGLTSIKFGIIHRHTLWSTSLDGTLRLWNLEKIEENGTIISKHEIGYTAMDISCDGTILAAGTEKNEETLKLHLEFWDIRKMEQPKLLATFQDIHSDDFTVIKFHPTNPKILVTGSTDGLIAVLDLTTYDEEDALVQTLNTESSVPLPFFIKNCVGFFGSSHEYLYGLTHIETFMLWKYMEGDLLTSIIDVRGQCPKSNSIDYIIECHYDEKTERLFIIGGTHRGKIEILHFNLEAIEPFRSMTGGHSSTIRCVLFSTDTLFTGAEDGMVCCWMSVTGPDSGNKMVKPTLHEKKKSKSDKKQRKKPYVNKESPT